MQLCSLIILPNGQRCNQTAFTIAKLFVKEIVCRHGVPSQLLSSYLMTEICKLLGTNKINTTVEQSGKDWDQHLPYILFVYRASLLRSDHFIYYMGGMHDC